MTALRLDLLGGFALRLATGEPVTLSAKKARALFAFLAMQGGQTQSRDKLAALLWEDSGEMQARTSLRQALTALRKAVPQGDQILRTDGETVALDPGTISLDVTEFEDLADADTPDALEQAVALYRGDLLDGFHVQAPTFETWVAVERARIRGLATGAMSALLEHDIALDAPDRAIRIANQLLALDPLDESVHRALMQIYMRLGRHGAALKQYRSCREVLRRELGVAPEPKTHELYRAVMARRQSGPGSDPGAEARADPEPDDRTSRPASVPAEMRQATVLFADLWGFAGISRELDPEELLALLDRYFDTIDGLAAQYGGRPERHFKDCVMVVFGAEVAHEDDPERAVRAALAIHEAMPGLSELVGRALQTQVGIANGRLLVTGGNRETNVTGDAVHLASRLTELAGPGETLISDPVRAALDDLWNTSAVSGTPIAGLGEDLRFWRLEGRTGATEPSHRRLIGRAPEMDRFADLLSTCRETGAGSAVLIRGEAGIGKTRLVEEVMARAEANGFDAHKSLVLDFGAGVTGDPIRRLVQAIVGLPANAQEDERRTAAEQTVAAGLIDRSSRGFLYDLLDVPPPGALAPIYNAMDNAARLKGKQDALVTLVTAHSRRRPLLAVIEDIHWADRLTLDRLAALAATTQTCPALLVMTARDDSDPIDAAWRTAANNSPLTRFDLDPLSQTEAEALAAEYGQLDPDFVSACVGRAEGNPLFLDQLMRGAASGDTRLPPSIESLVLARMDTLDAPDRRGLQAAAVLGQRFALPALRHLLEDAAFDLDTLISKQLVRPDGEEFLFHHALIQEAVSASLVRSQRRELHQRAAAWYGERDFELAARHLGSAGDPAAPAAYLRAAQDQAAKYRGQRALELAQEGEALAQAPADQQALACLRGELLHDLGSVEPSCDAFQHALAIAADERGRARAWLGIAAGMRILDRYDAALDALDRAEDGAQKTGDVGMLARIYTLRGNICFPRGDIEGCLAAHETALRHARAASSPESEAQALGGLGDAYYQRGRMVTAHEHFDRCIRLAEDHGLARIQVANLPMRGVTRFYQNDTEGGLADCRRAADLAVEIGDKRAEMLARNGVASMLPYLAAWDEAQESAAHSARLARELGARRFVIEDQSHIGSAMGGRGDRAAAEKTLREAYEVSLEVGPSYIAPWILSVLAIVTTDPKRRRWALAEGERILDLGCVSHNYLHFYQNAMDAALDSRDWAEVDRYAQALEDYTRDEPLPWAIFHIARGRALAACGRGARDAATDETLARLRDQARAARFAAALPAIEAALDKA